MGSCSRTALTGRLLLMVFSVTAVTVLYLWMSNAASRLVAISLGLIVGGALGNIADRVMHGAVADFFSFHYAGYYWYVFNIADVAITAGVIGLIIDWLITPSPPRAAAGRKAPAAIRQPRALRAHAFCRPGPFASHCRKVIGSRLRLRRSGTMSVDGHRIRYSNTNS